MALGHRKSESQEEMCISVADIPKSVGYVFFETLNELLIEAGYDRWIEELFEEYYSHGKGQSGIGPGV